MNILVYGDSMSWGIIPGSRNRQPRQKRWPGVMQQHLGEDCQVIEECLNGRTTQFDDPNRPKRNGLEYIQMVMEVNAPIDVVIVVLGVNDFQDVIGASARESAAGYGRVIERFMTVKPEPMSQPAQVLAVVQPDIQQPKNTMAEKFSGFRRGKGAEALYIRELENLDVPYIRASDYIQLSTVDGIHLDEPEHLLLGEIVAHKVRSSLALCN